MNIGIRLNLIFFGRLVKLTLFNFWSQLTFLLDVLSLFLLFREVNLSTNLILCLNGIVLTTIFISHLFFVKDHLILQKCQSILREHTYYINAISLSNDEKYLASCGGDHFALLWNLENKNVIYRMPHDGWVANIAFSPEDNYIYSLTGNSGTLNQWDLSKKKLNYSKPWFNSEARGLSISSDGERAALSSTSGKYVYINPTEKDFFDYLHPVSDGEVRKVIVYQYKLFMVSSLGEVIQVEFDPLDKFFKSKVIFKDDGNEMIRNMAITRDGATMAFTDSAGYLKILDLNEHQLLFREKAHNGQAVSVCYSPSENFVATGGQDNIIRIWKLSKDGIKKSFQIEGHSDTITSLAFSSDNLLYSASRDRSIRIWNLKGLK